jgi:hypothetical protein
MTYFLKTDRPDVTWNTQGTKGYVAFPDYTLSYRVNEENAEEGIYDAYNEMGTNLYDIGFDELEVSIQFTPKNP